MTEKAQPAAVDARVRNGFMKRGGSHPTERDPRSRTTRTAIRIMYTAASLLVLATLLSAIALIRGRAWMLNGPDTGLPLEHVPQIASADMDLWRVATALDLPVVTRLLSALPELVLGLALAAAAVLVARVVREIAEGRSFSLSARLGLGRLSLVLIIGGIASAVLDLVAVLNMQAAISPLRDAWVRELRDDAPWVSVSATPSVPVMVIVLGVVAAALMFALSDGARLEKDVEGVI